MTAPRAFAVALIALAPMLAAAQTPCGPVEDWLQSLHTQHGESVLWSGIGEDGKTVFIVTGNAATGSWTLGIRQADRPIVCTQASGVYFIAETRKPPGSA